MQTLDILVVTALAPLAARPQARSHFDYLDRSVSENTETYSKYDSD